MPWRRQQSGNMCSAILDLGAWPGDAIRPRTQESSRGGAVSHPERFEAAWEALYNSA